MYGKQFRGTKLKGASVLVVHAMTPTNNFTNNFPRQACTTTEGSIVCLGPALGAASNRVVNALCVFFFLRFPLPFGLSRCHRGCWVNAHDLARVVLAPRGARRSRRKPNFRLAPGKFSRVCFWRGLTPPLPSSRPPFLRRPLLSSCRLFYLRRALLRNARSHPQRARRLGARVPVPVFLFCFFSGVGAPTPPQTLGRRCTNCFSCPTDGSAPGGENCTTLGLKVASPALQGCGAFRKSRAHLLEFEL